MNSKWKSIIASIALVVLYAGCDGKATIDKGLLKDGYQEVVEDIAGNTNNIPVTAAQINSISGVSGAVDGTDYTAALQAAQNTTPSGYVNPDEPTAAEIQAVIDAVNTGPDTDGDYIPDTIDLDDDNDGASDTDEAASGTDPLNPDTDGDGIGDGADADGDNDGTIDTGNTDIDNDGITDEADADQNPGETDTDGDGIIDDYDLNDDNEDLLIAIGEDADGISDITPTADQLNALPGVSGAVAANESAYNDYIDANSDAFSAPATVEEVQNMITAVNAAVVTSNSVLAEIGEDDNNNASDVTIADLQSILPALTDINASNEAAYQNYIADSANAFSAPATVEEVQNMITAVNYEEGPHVILGENAKAYIVSTSINATYNPNIDLQGKIDANNITLLIPYTVVNGDVTLAAYSGTYEISTTSTEDDESSIIATLSWSTQTVAVGTGYIEATISIDDSAGNNDGTYNAKKLDVMNDTAGIEAASWQYPIDTLGNMSDATLKVVPGIPDRMYGQADNNGDVNSHNFAYLPVTNPTTGKIWLNNNLGADYTNLNHPSFDDRLQATASDDHHAYGSLFQWGRKADGHELITWTSGTAGTPVNGTTATNSDDPEDALFINVSDWRINQDDTLWAYESSTNNVCPVGYRLPTSNDGEWSDEIGSWDSLDSVGALASVLKLPMAGNRSVADGVVRNQNSIGYYWSASVSNSDARNLEFKANLASGNDINARGGGFAVRCIKE